MPLSQHINQPPSNRELDLDNTMLHTVTPFWQTREEGFLRGREGKKIYWVSMTNPKHNKAICISNGRVETVWKYQELFFDLYQQGFDIYAFDHRGQGLSDRISQNLQLGHVDCFDYYIDDLSRIVEHFSLNRFKHCFLLAHSMGGTIASRYIENPS